jgi:hypothetical protein
MSKRGGLVSLDNLERFISGELPRFIPLPSTSAFQFYLHHTINEINVQMLSLPIVVYCFRDNISVADLVNKDFRSKGCVSLNVKVRIFPDSQHLSGCDV